MTGMNWSGRAYVLVLVLMAKVASAQTLQPLSEEEMGLVTGQEGILVSLDYYYNSQKADNIADNGQAIPGFCSDPGTPGSLADPDCRFAIQIANHTDHWIVAKNGHASISVNRLSLDAAFLGDAASANSGGNNSKDNYFNEQKFLGVDGTTCLLEGPCTQATIDMMPALRTHYPETSGSYDALNKEITGYNDVRFGLYFEGLSVEFNDPLAPVGQQEGWQRNDGGSFIGVNIADNKGPQAGIAFGGDFYLYGF